MNRFNILPVAADVSQTVEIDYVNYRGERAVRRVTPVGCIDFGRTTFHPAPQWLMPAFDHAKNEDRVFAMNDVMRFGKWNEARERAAFEDAAYAHYMTMRARRSSKGQGIAFDTLRARPKHELLERTSGGDYVAQIYVAAWAGWKMARGGM